MQPSSNKVRIYAPSPQNALLDNNNTLLRLGSKGPRTLNHAESKASMRASYRDLVAPSRTSLSPTSGAQRRTSVLSEVGALVGPLSDDEVMSAVHRANDERAVSLIDRVRQWAMRPRDIFSLKLFSTGKSSISQVYRRGRLPQDAAWFVLDPKSERLKRWDIYIMVLLLWTAVVTPYEVGFTEPSLNFWFVLNRLIDLSFFLDLIINFITARFDDIEAKWIYRPTEIACIYLRSWFAIDLVSILPFDVMGLVMDSDAVAQFRLLRVVRLLRLLKLARILRASRIFRRWENEVNLSYSVMSLIKFMVGVTTIAHWMACTWRIVVDIEDAEDNWMVAYQADRMTNVEQYISALYWSVMTITTIGYGDVMSQTTGERVVATACMLLGASIYAYVVGAVCGIVSGLDEATSKFHQTMDQLNLYMAEYHIPRELQVSLREYFRHCRALSRQRYYHDLLVQMSPSLRGQVAVFCHSAWILKVPFFNSPSVSDEEREQFIIQIAMAIEPEAYPPNEPIFRVNNPAMQMYILQKGVVAKQGRVLRGGAYFGEDMILKNYKRPYSVRTLTYVDCFRLDKEKLLDIIRHDEFPATRIAIRRATIALAFRVKFMLMAKAVGVFSSAASTGGKTPHPRRTPSAASLQAATVPGSIPETTTRPNPLAVANDAAAAAAAAENTSDAGESKQRPSQGADAGAGDAKSVPRPALGGSDTLSDAGVEDTPLLPEGLSAPTPHTVMNSGTSYKQLRPSPAANIGPNVRDVIKVVDTKHQQTMETLMVEFSKMAKRFDSLANRLDDIESRTSKRGCC